MLLDEDGTLLAASEALAVAALETEHGWTTAEDSCAICEWTTDGVHIGDVIAGRRMTSTSPRPIQVYRPLHGPDGDCEVWVCRDEAACKARYDAGQVEGMAPAELKMLGMGKVIPIGRSRSRGSR